MISLISLIKKRGIIVLIFFLSLFLINGAEAKTITIGTASDTISISGPTSITGNLNVSGQITGATNLTGALSSGNVSAGIFGSNTGGGEYHFPSNVYLDGNYGKSIVGLYTSTRYQGVFAMGDAYKLPADGSNTGSLYGLAWSHPNAGGVASNLNTHGLLVMENGTFLAAISGSIRARDDIQAPIFYDRNNTGYYVDPNGNSVINTMTANSITAPNIPTRQDGSRYSTDFNSILASGFYNGEGTPANSPVAYGQLIVAKGIDTGLQIAGGYNNDNLYFRGWGYGPNEGFYPWRTIIHSGNIASQSVSNADMVDGIHGVDKLTAKINVASLDANTIGDVPALYGGSTVNWTNRGPSGHNGGAILHMPTHPGGYYSDLWFDTANNKIYSRAVNNGSIGGWSQLLREGDSVSSASNSDTVDSFHSYDFLRAGAASPAGNAELAQSTNDSSYSVAAIELRELNYGGTQTGVISEAPRISFHWSGRVASQIVMPTDGSIQIRNNPGTGYEVLKAGNIYSNDLLVQTVGGSLSAANVSAATFGANTGSGNYVFPATVTATTFVGALSGNATSATNATNATNAGNADTVDSLHVHSGTNNEANKIVRTDGSGYINAGWINTASGDNGTTALSRIYASSDGFIRYYTPANFRTVLDVPTRAGSGASGTWGISISGNAATATTAANSTKWANLDKGYLVAGKVCTIDSSLSVINCASDFPASSDSQTLGTSGNTITLTNGGSVTAPYATSAGSAGSASTAAALSANPSNCSAGQYPLGIAANGAAESCTAIPTNADTVDSQHFTWSNTDNRPTFVWGTNANGSSFLSRRDQLEVRYADYAQYINNDYQFMTFHWSGQGGQPMWLWGGENGVDMYVYNPSNFNVNYANSAGNAHTTDGQHLGTGDYVTFGQVTAGAFIYGSDRNLKKNIKTISDPLEKIKQLRGVTFDWKKSGNASVGLIAQEVEKVFPELVHQTDNGKAVEYGNLVAPLIEAVKEQQKEIDALNKRIKVLEARK